MALPLTDPLFDGLSDWGRSKLQALQDAGADLRNNFRTTPDDPVSALAASAGYLDLLDSLEGAVAGAQPAAGSVPADDLAQTGLLLQVGSAGDVRRLRLGEAASQMVAGLPLVIGGAGDPLATLVLDAYASGAALGGQGLLMQYTGINRAQFEPAAALAVLEPNVLKTAALQVLGSCLNEAGHASTVVSHGFACWVVNRSLRALPENLVAFAQNLEIDALGPADALQDLVHAKQDGLGAICHVQTRNGQLALANDFNVPSAMLAALPVDLAAASAPSTSG